MFNIASRYTRRVWELGLLGALQHAWTRLYHELSLWSQSFWWDLVSRKGMSDADLLANTTRKWSSVDALLDHLAARPSSSFLLRHESPHETNRFLHRDYPEHISAMIVTADAICRNELSLQGQVFHFPGGIDWNSDPVTGLRWPLLYRGRFLQYMYSTKRPTDIRKFWELNRHQHFVTLGIAYWLTGESKYVQAFNSQIESWIQNNPLRRGANWCLGIEISLRMIAWTVAFQFFRNSAEFREKTAKAFLKSLWQQADFLCSHLQSARMGVPNNQMIAELTGLVIVGTAFPEFRDSTVWRETGLRLLNEQALAQIHPDGVNKEQAMGYLRFVAELLLMVVAYSRRGALPNNPDLEHALEGMLDYVCRSLSPMGTVPMWGDSASGRALGLGKNKNFWDFRPILSAGAVLFGRPEWKFAAGRFDEEAFWLLGFEGLDVWNQLEACPPDGNSLAFTDGGIYVIRDSWLADTDMAILRGGIYGMGGEGHCAHSHCDLLSFVLWVNGQSVLVDSGTYTYHGPWRDHFRLTAAHNTVKVDDSEQALADTYFNWRQIPEAHCVNWTGNRVKATMTCVDHVGFTRDLSHPQPGTWNLTDEFTGKDPHSLEWFFHFSPDLELELNVDGHKLTVIRNGGPFLIMRLPENGLRFQVRDSWYSEQYGIKKSNYELYAQWHGILKEDDGVCFNWQFQFVDQKPLLTG